MFTRCRLCIRYEGQVGAGGDGLHFGKLHVALLGADLCEITQNGNFFRIEISGGTPPLAQGMFRQAR